ncbi:MAG: helix-turn-helix domain-containing protein [Ignavibacteria bacterium]|nr:helix-turn-helix domain-containing protein [Ignavibacteria bacterium]
MLNIFAEDLKAIREEKNISLRDVANKTRLNINILESLESGDYTFQPQAYIRAFMKQYIASIELDVEEVLFDYDLARSGKYKSKRQNVPPVSVTKSEPVNESIEIQPKEIKQSLTEKIKEIVNPAESKQEYNSAKAKEIQKETKSIPPVQETIIPKDTFEMNVQEFQEKKPKNKFSINPNTSKVPPVVPVNNKSSFSFSLLNSPIVKNIMLIIIVLLVLAGLYSLLNILFFEGNKSKTEIIRQNFDEVVDEQERKILGKRIPEEIQDSIKKAEEEFNSLKDSITLKITSVVPGTVYIVTDSVSYNKPRKIEFEKNETGTFKARKSFHISSMNTETFKVTINDKPVKFEGKSVSKVKVTKDGVVK